MTEQLTRTDLSGSRWGIHDEVIQLREWASQQTFVLRRSAKTTTLGASPRCTVHVDDPGVSQEHLQLTHVDGRWVGSDRGSKNGTRVDGVRTRMFSLTPGCEIRMGGVTMVAESRRWIELRQLLCRILGWADDQLETVDLAMRSIRSAAFGRSPLYLRGAGDLAKIALSLHRRVWGADRPFVMSDPRRVEADESVRSVANKPIGMDAFAAAHGGTMCMRADRPPADLDDVLRRQGRPGPRVLLVVVDVDPRLRYPTDVTANPPIQIPPLGRRIHELPRVIDEYAAEAAEELSLPRRLFTSEDRAWVLKHAAIPLAGVEKADPSLPEIERAIQRILALRGSHNITMAARRLNMAQFSLTSWFGRRAPPASLWLKLRMTDDD
jgi:hypothetical protein